jgi:hypothetical protein
MSLNDFTLKDKEDYVNEIIYLRQTVAKQLFEIESLKFEMKLTKN